MSTRLRSRLHRHERREALASPGSPISRRDARRRYATRRRRSIEPRPRRKARQRNPADDDALRFARTAARIDRLASIDEAAVALDRGRRGFVPATRRPDRLAAPRARRPRRARRRPAARCRRRARRRAATSEPSRVYAVLPRVVRCDEVRAFGRADGERIEREVGGRRAVATSSCCGTAPGVNARRTSAARSAIRSSAALIAAFKNTSAISFRTQLDADAARRQREARLRQGARDNVSLSCGPAERD